MSSRKALVVLAVCLFVPGLAFAWGKNPKGSGEAKECCMKAMQGHGKMMGMGKMKGMMERKVVATSDGGVVVVCCHKLTKYDKDLNVVKEVELKGMGEKGMCPISGKTAEDKPEEEAEKK